MIAGRSANRCTRFLIIGMIASIARWYEPAGPLTPEALAAEALKLIGYRRAAPNHEHADRCWRKSRHVQRRIATASARLRPTKSRAILATFSAVKPKWLRRSGAGPEAPKPFIATMRPFGPT